MFASVLCGLIVFMEKKNGNLAQFTNVQTGIKVSGGSKKDALLQQGKALGTSVWPSAYASLAHWLNVAR